MEKEGEGPDMSLGDWVKELSFRKFKPKGHLGSEAFSIWNSD